MFTGRQLAAEVISNINHPCNAFNAESNAHESYDKLAWGIEAVKVDSEVNNIPSHPFIHSRELTPEQWKYFFREIRTDEIAATITLRNGDEIIFQGGPDGQVINKPNPEYCNLKLAIARALHACGAADVIDEMYGDGDDIDRAIISQPVYLGGPFVSDDDLFRRLHDRLLT